MPLRLSAEGTEVVSKWRTRHHGSPGDEDLVAAVLRAVARRDWQGRWHHRADPAEPDITIIDPRPGLSIRIRLWEPDAPEEFTVVSIAG